MTWRPKLQKLSCTSRGLFLQSQCSQRKPTFSQMWCLSSLHLGSGLATGQLLCINDTAPPTWAFGTLGCVWSSLHSKTHWRESGDGWYECEHSSTNLRVLVHISGEARLLLEMVCPPLPIFPVITFILFWNYVLWNAYLHNIFKLCVSVFSMCIWM